MISIMADEPTAARASFGDLAPGRRVNLEIDLVARYLERLGEWGQGAGPAGVLR